MKKKRIACISYHKFPDKDWPVDEFYTKKVKLASGEEVTLCLAERGIFLSKLLWVREIRKLSEGGHQTSILATDFTSDFEKIAVAMFARWSQENFFKYMIEHYNLDRLVDYSTKSIPDTIQVTNPKYRQLTSELKSKTTKRSRHLAKFGALNLEAPIETVQMEIYQKLKSSLQDEISYLDREITDLKIQRQKVQQHIKVSDLPKEQRFSQLSAQTKNFVDTIKMIAYRAETAMADLARESIARSQDARALLRSIYTTEVDLIPSEKFLTVRLHHQGLHCSDEVVRNICTTLNETNTVFPGTKLQLFYELVSSKNPEGQDV